MTTAKKLSKSEVDRWMRGQKAADRKIEKERVRYLRQLTPDESLRTYLSLKEACPDDPHAGPSPLLMVVRRVLKKHAEDKGGRR